MKILYLDVGIDGFVCGYSSSEAPGLIQIELPDDHPFPEQYNLYRYENEEIIYDISKALNKAKAKKGELLSVTCERTIEEGFFHEIDGVNYRFSYDIQAQLNFQSTRIALINASDPFETRMWTVRYSDSMEYARIPIDLFLLDELIAHGEAHRVTQVSKLRDFILPLVIEAQSFEELDEINWT